MDLSNSHSLTDFQRNARAFIEDLNETKTPMLLTVNGKVQAVMVDPATYTAMEEAAERERFLQAIREGLESLDQGEVVPLELVVRELQKRYGV